MWRSIGLALLFSCLTNCDVIVQTKYGKIRGLQTPLSQAFLGVPYAAPPVGNLRWKSPQPPKPWDPALYNATEVMPGCPQMSCEAENPALVCPNKTDESCLFLYIWAPLSTTPSSKLPVMVYLHGGNFARMSAGSLLFNGEYFAQRGNVILVNVDYRLGALGFLYTGKREGDSRGNYGLQDQRLALQWVQENIAAFGGDPSKVTLFGQSAGAQSTFTHMMSGKASGLFRNAILESAPLSIPYHTATEALILGYTIAELANCTPGDMQCLRSKTADEIAEAQWAARSKVSSLKLLEFFEPIGPFVDGDEVPMQAMEAIIQDKVEKIPVMLGSVMAETRIYVYNAFQKAMSIGEYSELLLATFPTHILQVFNRYPPFCPTDCRDILVETTTDFIFFCPARNFSTHLVENGNSAVWIYEFYQYFSFPGWGNFTFCEMHVCHGEEIVYVFHTADKGGFHFTPDEERLSNTMIGYWTNFAHTSDPNNGPAGEKDWSNLLADQQNILFFEGPGDGMATHYRKSYCDVWDKVGYKA